MAAYFFDSSALAKRFIRETGTAFVLSLWRPFGPPRNLCRTPDRSRSLRGARAAP
jgi:hypothetical protein